MNTGTVPTDKMTWALDSAISLLIAREMTGVAEGLHCAKVQLQQLRAELAQRTKEADHWTHRAIDLSAGLAAKDKVLEWYGDEKNYYKTILDEGEKARSILSQYSKEGGSENAANSD